MCQSPNKEDKDKDKGLEAISSEFLIELTENMKELPFEALEDIARRPWDFIE